jgi:hypothetical protein
MDECQHRKPQELHRSNLRHEGHALLIGFDPHALELLPKSHVCMETRRIFVEVQEGLRPAVKDAGFLLDQSGHRAKPVEQRLDFMERLGGGVPHVTTLYFGILQADPLTGSGKTPLRRPFWGHRHRAASGAR